MKIRYILLLINIVNIISGYSVYAQKDTLLHNCSKYLTGSYISDGQEYRALLNEDETAEFKITFYEGTRYRIICCSNTPGAVINYSLYDIEGNSFFANKDYNNTSYWDFTFKSTINCVITAEVDRTTVNSAVVFFLIGYQP